MSPALQVELMSNPVTGGDLAASRPLRTPHRKYVGICSLILGWSPLRQHSNHESKAIHLLILETLTMGFT